MFLDRTVAAMAAVVVDQGVLRRGEGLRRWRYSGGQFHAPAAGYREIGEVRRVSGIVVVPWVGRIR